MATEFQSPRIPADTRVPFRLGQLLVLFEVADRLRAMPIDIDRLGYYEFLAGNPFLVVSPVGHEARVLAMAGFERRNLDYQSSSQRFSNRRARLQHDLALLAAYGLLVQASRGGRVAYQLSAEGREAAGQLQAFYADGLRRSADVVIRHLRGLSDAKLRESVRHSLSANELMIELYD